MSRGGTTTDYVNDKADRIESTGAVLSYMTFLIGGSIAAALGDRGALRALASVSRVAPEDVAVGTLGKVLSQIVTGLPISSASTIKHLRDASVLWCQ